MHNRGFRWFSAAPLVFLFLGFLPSELNQIWRTLCVTYVKEGGRGIVWVGFLRQNKDCAYTLWIRIWIQILKIKIRINLWRTGDIIVLIVNKPRNVLCFNLGMGY
jgi:hypothetical protein